MPGHRHEDIGYDNVLRDQIYGTPQGAVTDWGGAMVEWWLAGENWRNSERNLLECHFVDHEFHMKSLGIKPEAPQWEARNRTAWTMAQPSRKTKGSSNSKESRAWLAIITERPWVYSFDRLAVDLCRKWRYGREKGGLMNRSGCDTDITSV
jgi:hypothetical protein